MEVTKTSSYNKKILLIYGYSEGGTGLGLTSILFIKNSNGQNWATLFHKISVNLMLNSPNLLYRYRKFVVLSVIILSLKRTHKKVSKK